MVNNLKNIFDKLKSSKNFTKIIVIIGIIGILLIMLSEITPSTSTNSKKDTKKVEECSYSEYIDQLEDETQDIISSINGVGNCKVMLTLKSSDENIYAKNSENSKDDGSYSEDYEYVLYNSNDGETPILVKKYLPEIQGVVVVCDGGDNIVVKENVINSVSSLFNISSSRISVLKINNQKR